MLYFSELEGKEVYTDDEILIGHVDDCIFTATGEPIITKLVLRSNIASNLTVTAKSIKRIGRRVVLHKAYEIADIQENELYIKRNLLDKQIIDLTGNKVVRVNDVAIQNKSVLSPNETYVLELVVTGVDIGAMGILRRLGVENTATYLFSIFGQKITSDFLPWGEIQPLELSRGTVQLKKEEEKLENLRPEDLADYLEKTNEKNIRKFLKILDSDVAVKVISNLAIAYQKDLFQHWRPEKAASLLSQLDDDIAVDILLVLSRRKREEIIAHLDDKKRKEITTLLNLSKTPIGQRLYSEYLTVKPQQTVKQIIDQVKQQTTDFTFFHNIYVVNERNMLVGVVSLHELMLQDLTTPIYRFMEQNIVEVTITTPVEVVINKMLKYRLSSIPVVNKDRHMLGIITLDDIVDVIRSKLS